MAIVLDINILCNKMLDISTITMLLTKYKVSIESVISIDNWMWDNETKVEYPKQIADLLDMRRIVVIKLKGNRIKDIGVYIEKIENQYLYSLWINTEGYPMLDCEKVTDNNFGFYNSIMQTIIELNSRGDCFEVVGIGLETEIAYANNVLDIIQKSKNVMIWMINKHYKLNIELEGFKNDVVEGMHILQRK